MGREIEMKYVFSEPVSFEQILEDPLIKPYIIGEVKEYDMCSEYFDTKYHLGKRAKTVFRRRRENDETLIYAKFFNLVDGGLSIRGEWSIESDDIQNAAENLAKVGAPTREFIGIPLFPQVEIKFKRREVKVKPCEKLTFLLSYDEGMLGEGEPFCELEMEKVEGDTGVLMIHGDQLAEKYKLIEESRSKYMRALGLKRRERKRDW